MESGCHETDDWSMPLRLFRLFVRPTPAVLRIDCRYVLERLLMEPMLMHILSHSGRQHARAENMRYGVPGPARRGKFVAMADDFLPGLSWVVRLFLLFACASLALAQGGGTEPKAKAEDYEAHGQLKDIAIGAEFMIHSFSGQGETYIAKDFLVVEVALFPPKGQAVDVNGGAFSLRINGNRKPLMPAAPGMVIASLERPEWQSGPRLEGGGGLGNTGVILGRPVPSQVPNGQPVPTRRPSPVPDPTNPVGVERQEHISATDLVGQTALPEGHFGGAVSGYLYFPFRGKSTSIKSLELLWKDAVIKLR